MRMLIHPPVEEARLEKIRRAAGSMEVVNCAGPEEALAGIRDADALFGKMTAALLERAGKLRWIQSPTASLEHYMFPALVEHPVVLTNMRGLFSDVIADQVMGYVLCFARNLHVYIRQQAERRWAPCGTEAFHVNLTAGPGVVTGVDRVHRHLAGAVMGIVGYGAIGQETGRRAEAFGMRVIAVDPVNPAAWPLERLDDLLAESDYVVVAAPHTPRTVRMFGIGQFRKMKREAVFINIGRGAVVDLNGLVEALREGAVAGCALDVYETEPLPAEHPLWGFGNAILTPHVAGYAVVVPERHLEVLLDNTARFVAGRELRNVVNKAEWF
ncbi:MAG: D-2-hydroxyacid dehydrogenase [Acidobacteria bacterium]|nr:D-2-hydroxyacid dehydrogenase [Acidobacteriota bacterium]